ncbi:MAG: hypothetical protein BWY72_01633 [Bacteroidetes bacterium ADurb.Bin416]|nr:MAG: hypothetical protein BWY72_01633 [Bacteroidetes bacterium ADurb.Bin416]
MTIRIILPPKPPIFILDNPSLRLDEAIIIPNILPKISLETAGLCFRLMTFRPQNVKKMVTFLPMEAAPLAITNVANALSRSSLKQISVASLLPAVSVGAAWGSPLRMDALMRLSS